MPIPRITALAILLAAGPACGHALEPGSPADPDAFDEGDDAADPPALDNAPDAPAPPPVHAVLENVCAPGGGDAWRIRLDLEAPRCDVDVTDTDALFLFRGGPLAPGVYPLEEGGGFAFVRGDKLRGSKAGQVVITAWGERVTGSYAFTLKDGTTVAGAFAGPVCLGARRCG